MGIRMRALLAIGLAAAGVFLIALTSCLAPSAPRGKILIEFWDFPRLPAVSVWLQEAIESYQEQNPHVHIVYTRLSWGKGGERLDIAAFAGRPPDVAGAVLQLKYVEAGLIYPLDEWIDEDIPDLPGRTYREDIHPPVLADVQWDGQTWAFPWYKEAFVLMLNRDIFEERNVALPEDGQWTWDEFLDKMHRLTFDRSGDGRIDVYGTGFSTGPQKWEAYPYIFAEGARLLDESGRRVLLDSDATRRGIGRLLQMEYEEQVSLPGAGGFMDDTTWSAFTGRNRSLASVSQGLWAIRSIRTQNQRLEQFIRDNPGATDMGEPLRTGVALFPRMPGQPQRAASYGVGSLMVFNRPLDPERTREAARFARYLTLEAGQEINREAGLFPSRISTGNLMEGDRDYDAIWPYIAEAVSPPVHPAWPQLDQVVGEHLQLILLRQIGLDEGVTRMAERCQYLLDLYWEGRGEPAKEDGHAFAAPAAGVRE